jgi:hypothetical protein
MKKVKTYLSVSPQLIQGYDKYIGASMFSPQLLNNPHISFNVFDNGHINYRNHYAFNNLQRTSLATEQQAKEVVSEFITDYRKNIQQCIEWKKVDENFPALFHRYLKHINSSQVFNKKYSVLQYWILNYIAELDSVIDEDSRIIRTSPLNNENVSFYVGGQGQVIGMDYNHIPLNKIITSELMNVFASTEAPNIIYKRNSALNTIAPYYANEKFELLPASSKSIEPSNNSASAEPSAPVTVKANLFPEISISLIDTAEVLKTDPDTNTVFDSVTHIYSFISLVEEIENKYSTAEQKNTAYMITQFRKAYYNSDNWNTRLIPNTNDEVNKLKISKDDIKRLKDNRTVRALDSAKVDISHVFVGMDAFNHQGSIVSPCYAFWISIQNSLDAASWLGDLASIIAYVWRDIYDSTKDADKYTDDEIIPIWRNAIENFSTSIDLLGDIDGIVMGANLPISKKANGKKISELLRDYYLQENNTTIKSNRMQLFATAIGLGDIDGEKYKNETAFVAKYQHEITDAALLVIAGSIGKGTFLKASKDKKEGNTLLSVKGGAFVLNAFIKALKENWAW